MNYIESTYHLLIECPRIKALWADLENWLRIRFQVPVKLDPSLILFGSATVDTVTNQILLISKYEIYKHKFSGSAPSLDVVVNKIVRYYELEKYNANKKIVNKWRRLAPYFENFNQAD
jgi:hypothetical protein